MSGLAHAQGPGTTATIEALRFDVAQSLCYHEKRRVFFEMLGKTLEFLALIGSAGALLALLEVDAKGGAIVLSALAAISLLVNLVLGPGYRLERHTALRNRLLDLEERLGAGDASESALERCAQLRRDIRKDEPPLSPWLVAICHNETLAALGDGAGRRKPVAWYYRLAYLKMS